MQVDLVFLEKQPIPLDIGCQGGGCLLSLHRLMIALYRVGVITKLLSNESKIVEDTPKHAMHLGVVGKLGIEIACMLGRLFKNNSGLVETL